MSQVLIVFILYLGNTAASLTTLRLDTGSISSLADLRGKAVGTWTDYADDTLRYGITATSFPWDTAADEDAMFSALATGEVKALVLDGTLLDYKSATDCAFSTVGEAFNPYDQTTAFPKGFEAPELLTAYNDALVSLQSNGDVQNLVDTYVNAASGLCDELSTSRVAFHQVSGLWILLAGCIGFAGVLLALQVAHAKWVAPRLRASP
jgi:ABC-type amino acid transport substrate-binding protein